MKIIMLTGDSNRGKTATLVFVHEILAAYKAKTTCFKRVEDEKAKIQRDFSSVLIYRGKKIRIYSMGDEEDKLKEILSERKYNFLVCACNNEHRKFFRRADYRFEKTVAKTYAYSRLEANLYDTGRIIELLV
jgi:hypothetical protein